MWKRLTLSLVAVAALCALVMGASFALFTASTTNSSNTFTAGTLTLGGNFSDTFAVTNMVPGDSGDKYYTISYTGNVPAWVGLNTAVGAPAGVSLLTCNQGLDWNTPGLVISVDNKTLTGTATKVYQNHASNQLLNPGTPAVNGQSFPIHVHYSLPTSVGNGCQGASAFFIIHVDAIQADHNTTGGGPTTW